VLLHQLHCLTVSQSVSQQSISLFGITMVLTLTASAFLAEAQAQSVQPAACMQAFCLQQQSSLCIEVLSQQGLTQELVLQMSTQRLVYRHCAKPSEQLVLRRTQLCLWHTSRTALTAPKTMQERKSLVSTKTGDGCQSSCHRYLLCCCP